MGFQSCSMLVKVGFVLSILGFLFSVVGVFSPSWLVNETFKQELSIFYHCTDGECTTDSSDAQTWQEAAAAMEGVGIGSALLCLVSAVLFVLVPATSGKAWVKVATLVMAYATGVFILIGVIIYAARKDDFPEVFPGFRLEFDLGWSFALTIVGSLLYLTTGAFFTLDILV